MKYRILLPGHFVLLCNYNRLILPNQELIFNRKFLSSYILDSEGVGRPHSSDHCPDLLPSPSGLTSMAETWKLAEIEIEWE